MVALSILKSQAIALHKTVLKGIRRLDADRLLLGRKLIAIRKQIMTKARDSAFCDWLESAGFNVGSAYGWMRLAEGRPGLDAQPSRRRIVYWQNLHQKMKKISDEKSRIALFIEGVEYLKKTYRIKATVTIKAL